MLIPEERVLERDPKGLSWWHPSHRTPPICGVGILPPPLSVPTTILLHPEHQTGKEHQSQEGAGDKLSPTPGIAGFGKAGYTGAVLSPCGGGYFGSL